MNSKEELKYFVALSTLNFDKDGAKKCDIIKKDLEVLEEFEILKNYYEPFKQFLEDMFEKGHNEDLTKLKEWLENE